ncbi:phosphate acetyltransferase [Candidatus Omnitrophota bacterium]
MMDTIKKIREGARLRPKTVVLPESEDQRVLEAAKFIENEKIAKVILLGKDKINDKDKEYYIKEFYQLRKAKGVKMQEVKKIFESPLYCAAMMVRSGKADAFVAGASNTTPDVARAAIWCLGVDERMKIASSAFIMVAPNSCHGEKGTLIFADCGIVPDPNPRQMACIAIESAGLAKRVLGIKPRVALLSYSTKGSAKGKSIDKVREALGILREMAPELSADGEIQVDAAIVPEVAKIKHPQSPLGGKANVLIFPNLDAGNIGYKLVQRLAGARAVGPLLLGLNAPCSDMSRGCSVEDIVDCVAAVSIMAK